MQIIYAQDIRTYMFQRSTAIMREEHLKINVVERLMKPFLCKYVG
jgi:hypothetical protein